jgi:hypothetical protein
MSAGVTIVWYTRGYGPSLTRFASSRKGPLGTAQRWNVPVETQFYVSAAALPLVVLSIPGVSDASGHKVANNKDCNRAVFLGSGQIRKAA